MAAQLTPEAKSLIKLIERLAFPEETKTAWLEAIKSGNINEELLHDIRTKLNELPANIEGGDWNKARDVMEFTGIMKRWRLSQGSQHFHGSRR